VKSSRWVMKWVGWAGWAGLASARFFRTTHERKPRTARDGPCPPYRSTASSRRSAMPIGTMVATTHSTAAAPKPKTISVIDVGVP
jgi:hypothetical protein